MFQSLFCWISHLEFPRMLPDDPHILFQSLFCWISHLELRRLELLVMFFRFQSLFCWISHLERYYGKQPRDGSGVSILVLLDQSFRAQSPDHRAQYDPVSILVLLDQSFRANSKWMPCCGVICFNPCSVGSVI